MKRKMSLHDACKLVPDDLSDGAYWAMAHEIAGAEFGDAWEELPSHPAHKPFRQPSIKQFKCRHCGKHFVSQDAADQHASDKHRDAQ
jgi:hypothetical protein